MLHRVLKSDCPLWCSRSSGRSNHETRTLVDHSFRVLNMHAPLKYITKEFTVLFRFFTILSPEFLFRLKTKFFKLKRP